MHGVQVGGLWEVWAGTACLLGTTAIGSSVNAQLTDGQLMFLGADLALLKWIKINILYVNI